MTSSDDALPRLDLLVCGSGVNFLEGDLAISTIVLVRTRGADGREVRLVIDTGHSGMRRSLLEGLAKHSLTPPDIDFVFLTHVHWDHVQNIDLFTNAKIVLSREEWASIQGATPRDLMTPAWTKYLLPEDRVIAVDPGQVVVPGIEFIAVPGHAAGCIAFAVQLRDQVSIVTGDAIPWAEVARSKRSALVFAGVQRSQDSIEKLVARGGVMYPGHDRPFRLVNGEVEYLIDFDMTMFGADPSTPGLKFAPPAILTTLDLSDGEPVGRRWTKEELRSPSPTD